jgi:hypothetical protein
VRSCWGRAARARRNEPRHQNGFTGIESRSHQVDGRHATRLWRDHHRRFSRHSLGTGGPPPRSEKITLASLIEESVQHTGRTVLIFRRQGPDIGKRFSELLGQRQFAASCTAQRAKVRCRHPGRLHWLVRKKLRARVAPCRHNSTSSCGAHREASMELQACLQTPVYRG